VKNAYLGIDGGGTKTDFVIADSNGILIKRITLGASNPNDVGFSKAKDILRQGIVEVSSGYEMGRVSMFAGLAGYSDEAASYYKEFFSGFGFSEFKIGNDAQSAVAMCLNGDDGIAVIMGTGSIVYCQAQRSLYRVGGYGQLFGDAGSGFALGRDAILAALQYEDGSGDKTVLYEYVRDKCGGNTVLEKLDSFYSGGKRIVADYAPIVLKAYAEGDTVAREIVERNMEEIVRMIKGASQRLPLDNVTVCLCGGVAQHSNIPISLIREKLSEEKKKYNVSICKEPIYWGALRLAGMRK